MPMTASQGGLAGEQQFSSCVTFTSDGDLELFKPLTDDDHTERTPSLERRTLEQFGAPPPAPHGNGRGLGSRGL